MVKVTKMLLKTLGNSNNSFDGLHTILVEIEAAKRHLWNVGKIESLILRRKGIIRGAKMRLGADGKQCIIGLLELLYPLEVQG